MKRFDYSFHYPFWELHTMRRIPKYALHKATGQALVRLDGRAHYLGQHGTDESRQKYDQLIAGWLSGNRSAAPSQ
ncbi:MAG: hypothetical protein WAO83_01880, partial [Fuerstiella sp.]